MSRGKGLKSTPREILGATCQNGAPPYVLLRLIWFRAEHAQHFFTGFYYLFFTAISAIVYTRIFAVVVIVIVFFFIPFIYYYLSCTRTFRCGRSLAFDARAIFAGSIKTIDTFAPNQSFKPPCKICIIKIYIDQWWLLTFFVLNYLRSNTIPIPHQFIFVQKQYV